MNVQANDVLQVNETVARGESGNVSRASFWRLVNVLIDQLSDFDGPRCALVCHQASHIAAGFVALNHSGRVVVLPPTPKPESLRRLGVVVDFVITDEPEQFSDYKVLPIPEVSTADDASPVAVLDDNANIEFYTSGSSHQPDCIVQSFGMMRREMDMLEQEWHVLLGDAMFVTSVPHYHRFGMAVGIVWPLLTQRTFYQTSCTTPAKLQAAVGTHDSVIVSSPAFLKRSEGGRMLPPVANVNALLSSGAPLSDTVAEQLACDWGQPAIEIYGSTETGGVAWRCWNSRTQSARWQPFKCVDIELRPTAFGDRLWMRAPHTNGWMPSGDLARYDGESSFELLGRADGVVKIEDTRVSRTEMSARLRAHVWVDDAELIVLKNKRIELGAALILNAQGQAMLEQQGRRALVQRLRQWLDVLYPTVVVPRHWRFVNDWVYDGMGKITQSYLLGLFEGRHD